MTILPYSLLSSPAKVYSECKLFAVSSWINTIRMKEEE